MKRVICLLALMLVVVIGLCSTTSSNVSPNGLVPGLIDPSEDHPWGGNEFRPSIGSSSPNRTAVTPGSSGNFFIDLYFRYMFRPLLNNTIRIHPEFRHSRPTTHSQPESTTIPTQGSGN